MVPRFKGQNYEGFIRRKSKRFPQRSTLNSMNFGYTHGSNGDMLKAASVPRVISIQNIEMTSHAPSGTGEALRLYARDGEIEKLRELAQRWKGDPVINEEDVIGLTALHTAASHSHVECVKILLQCGADRHHKNHVSKRISSTVNAPLSHV